ncbi:hypothetical protein J2780_001158 [Chryseobacterium camelliae]|nr:hypothetical protein [Chryseobacterium camelliae]
MLTACIVQLEMFNIKYSFYGIKFKETNVEIVAAWQLFFLLDKINVLRNNTG